MRTKSIYKGQEIRQNSEHRFYVNRFNDEYEGVVMFTSEERAKDYIDKHLTYDVQFDDDSDSNSKGWRSSLEDCRKYIDMYNGTNESYFADYKGGVVSIVCNETGETVYEEAIK